MMFVQESNVIFFSRSFGGYKKRQKHLRCKIAEIISNWWEKVFLHLSQLFTISCAKNLLKIPLAHKSSWKKSSFKDYLPQCFKTQQKLYFLAQKNRNIFQEKQTWNIHEYLTCMKKFSDFRFGTFPPDANCPVCINFLSLSHSSSNPQH